MSSGYQKPTYEQTRAQVVSKWKATWGENANTASDSPDGLQIDILSLFLDKDRQALLDNYNQHFIGTATDQSLQALLQPLFGISAIAATPTSGEVWLYGDEGTVIPAAAEVSVVDTGSVFQTQADVTIAAGSYFVLIFPDVDTPTVVEVTVNGELSGTGAIDGDAIHIAEQVAAALVGNSNVVTLALAGSQSDGQAILFVQMTGDWAYSVTGAGEAFPANAVFAIATSTGPTSAAAGTVTQMNTSIDGWAGVTNIVDLALGTNQETNAQYRARHAERANSKGFATAPGLRAQLKMLTGVQAARVFVNTSILTDPVSGRPPKSFEPVVLGGDSLEIAETIWLCHTTGTESYGTTSVSVTDDHGYVEMGRDIQFSRPSPRYMWARITITRGEGFPSLALADIQSMVQQDVQAWGNSLGGDEQYGIGRDIYRVEVGGRVLMKLAGVAALGVELAATSSALGPPTYANVDIAITDRQYPIFAASRVQVLFV